MSPIFRPIALHKDVYPPAKDESRPALCSIFGPDIENNTRLSATRFGETESHHHLHQYDQQYT